MTWTDVDAAARVHVTAADVTPLIDRLRAAGWGDTFTLDVGVLHGDPPDQLTLVEVNDRYAVGAYEIDAMNYLEFIAAGWRELSQLNLNLNL
jgi:ATP-grasp domain, R2K clade family 2